MPVQVKLKNSRVVRVKLHSSVPSIFSVCRILLKVRLINRTLEHLPTGTQGQVMLVKNGRLLEKPELSEGNEDVLRLVMVTTYILHQTAPEVIRSLKEGIRITSSKPTAGCYVA